MSKRVHKVFAPRPQTPEADIEWRTAFKSGIAGVSDLGLAVEWPVSYLYVTCIYG